MMSAHDFYQIISSIVPLYLFIFIGYGSVKWWKFFNQEQCLGISRFCSLFAVPVLSFDYITRTNLYEMNLKVLVADVLQKVIVLVVLAFWYKFGPGRSIEGVIAIFSVCTLPNTLILGVPIIRSMYHATPLVVQFFVTQSMIWHTLLLIMYEYRATKMIIPQQFGDAYGRDVEIDTTATSNLGGACGISSNDTTVEEAESIGGVDVGGGNRVDLEIPVHLAGHEFDRKQTSVGNEQREVDKIPSTLKTEMIRESEYQRASGMLTSMPSTSLTIKHIVIMVWRKLKDNPNTYSTSIALICAFVSSKFHIAMPLILIRSVTFLSNSSLGMGMFNVGLAMGLQPTLIPCGKLVAALTMVLRFIIGPIVMALASLVVGLHGIVFRIAVVQAAISQGVVPSVFAVEYNVYPKIFNFGMIFGIVIALPVTLLYGNLLEIQG